MRLRRSWPRTYVGTGIRPRALLRSHTRAGLYDNIVRDLVELDSVTYARGALPVSTTPALRSSLQEGVAGPMVPPDVCGYWW